MNIINISLYHENFRYGLYPYALRGREYYRKNDNLGCDIAHLSMSNELPYVNKSISCFNDLFTNSGTDISEALNKNRCDGTLINALIDGAVEQKRLEAENNEKINQDKELKEDNKFLNIAGKFLGKIFSLIIISFINLFISIKNFINLFISIKNKEQSDERCG